MSCSQPVKGEGIRWLLFVPDFGGGLRSHPPRPLDSSIR